MPERKRVELLCEDTAHRSFIVTLCKALDWELRVAKVCPKASGDAKKWVRANYPGFVKAHRARRNHQPNLVALVVVDGDNEGVAARKRELDACLTECVPPLGRREPTELIVVFVPTWSIETWLMFLCGQPAVDETRSLKHAVTPLAAKGIVSPRAAVDGWMKPRESGGAPELPSIEDARGELAERCRN